MSQRERSIFILAIISILIVWAFNTSIQKFTAKHIKTIDEREDCLKKVESLEITYDEAVKCCSVDCDSNVPCMYKCIVEIELAKALKEQSNRSEPPQGEQK
jgi:hypothetical protein